MAVVVRAEEEGAGDADAEFEARLAQLRKAKGTKGRGKEAKKQAVALEETAETAAAVDFSDEKVFYEGKPAVGDLAVNVALGATLLWLPLTLASVGRYLWVNYRVTDKRISVESNSPLRTEKTDVSYDKIVKVVALGRGVGLWGDMVINLKDGSKVEIRALDRWQEIKAYIEQRVAEVESKSAESTPKKSKAGFT